MDEIISIPFNHFLAWKYNISFFSADRRFFTGARNDWPRRSFKLNRFHVVPGIVVNENGLCILSCETHGKGLFKSIIHVPRHPHFEEYGFPDYPDTTAAAILCPNVVRAGKMHMWTHSTNVVESIGGYTGLSSSIISPQNTV